MTVSEFCRLFFYLILRSRMRNRQCLPVFDEVDRDVSGCWIGGRLFSYIGLIMSGCSTLVFAKLAGSFLVRWEMSLIPFRFDLSLLLSLSRMVLSGLVWSLLISASQI